MNRPRPFLTALCFVLFAVVFAMTNLRPFLLHLRDHIPEKPRLDIRAAHDHDARRIAALFVQLGYAAIPAERLTRLLRHPDIVVFVAQDTQAVQGVLVLNIVEPLHVAQPWALISALVVDEALRSHGAGAALVNAAQLAAAVRGCAHVELSCSARRTRAHAFYEALGFEEVRKRFVKKLAA